MFIVQRGKYGPQLGKSDSAVFLLIIVVIVMTYILSGESNFKLISLVHYAYFALIKKCFPNLKSQICVQYLFRFLKNSCFNLLGIVLWVKCNVSNLVFGLFFLRHAGS